MMAASAFPRHYDITIIAEHLPGDYRTKEWASPWAGAIWVGVHDSSPREQQMQLEGLAGLLKLAKTNPGSSVRQIEMTEIMDRGSKDDVWYAGKIPNFRFMAADELPEGALYGMKYTTVVLTPQVFLLWLYERLQKRGIKFRRVKISRLSDLGGLGHDVLINASGIGSATLKDSPEKNLVINRLQCVVSKAPHYDRLFIRRGPNGYYSTAFSRLDGTVYVGGVLTQGEHDMAIYDEQRDLVSLIHRGLPFAVKRELTFGKICKNAHMNQPDVFPSPDPKKWPILYDHVGCWVTLNNAGVKCEKEIVDEQKVIHAYGQNAGGYVYSFGLAREVVKLAESYLYGVPVTGKL